MEEKIDKCLNEQRLLIGEREQLIGVINEGNDELKRLEAELTEFYTLHPNYCDDDSRSLVILAIDLIAYNAYCHNFFFYYVKGLDQLWTIRKYSFKNYRSWTKVVGRNGSVELIGWSEMYGEYYTHIL